MARKTNIEVNGKNYFRVTRTVGRKADGTAIRKQFYGTGINEANAKADEYINNIKNGLVNNFENVTLNDMMHTWLFDVLHNSSKIKPSTFQRYESIYRKYIKVSEIAGLKLANINTLKLQQFYNKLSKEYSYSQIKYLNSVLKTFFNWCIDSSYILKNPCLKVDIKGNKSEVIQSKRNEVEILTEVEINKIKEYIKGTDMEILILLDLATGLRQGELLALSWEDIDLDNKTLTVNKSVKEVYIYEDENNRHIETIFQVPKTQNSFRTISIPDVLISVLKKRNKKEGLVFHDENRKPLRAKNVSYQWKKILANCNIPHKKFHAIRHTYASMLLKNGVDIETVAELMGHSAISITQIYLHSSNNQKQDAVNKLNYLF